MKNESAVSKPGVGEGEAPGLGKAFLPQQCLPTGPQQSPPRARLAPVGTGAEGRLVRGGGEEGTRSLLERACMEPAPLLPQPTNQANPRSPFSSHSRFLVLGAVAGKCLWVSTTAAQQDNRTLSAPPQLTLSWE